MKETARTVALDALLHVEGSEGYSNIVIDKALKAAGLDQRDSALASVIFYGVLEKRITLDYLLQGCLRNPGQKLDPVVRDALRIGAYQILFLDRIPVSAAVNESVNAVKSRGKEKLAGFVNGVLRNLIRRRETLSLPEGDSPKALSIRCSVPEPLIRLWERSYGRETAQRLLESFRQRAETFVRLNPFCQDQEALEESFEEGVRLCRFVSPGSTAVLEGGGDPSAMAAFEKGLFHVQDLSAQLVCELLAPQPGETVCDCCSAPGGKSFTLAQLMEGRGHVYSFDLYPHRVKLVEEGARRLKIPNITARAADLTKPLADMPLADKVLCDVPCSGFGVIRRKPEIRYKALESLHDLPQLQFSILQNASHMVKPGGVLFYSTCTLNPAENGQIAQRFLRENPGFQPAEIRLPAVDRGKGAGAEALCRVAEEPANHLTMMPFSGASDGFFAAAFIRRTS